MNVKNWGGKKHGFVEEVSFGEKFGGGVGCTEHLYCSTDNSLWNSTHISSTFKNPLPQTQAKWSQFLKSSSLYFLCYIRWVAKCSVAANAWWSLSLSLTCALTHSFSVFTFASATPLHFAPYSYWLVYSLKPPEQERNHILSQTTSYLAVYLNVFACTVCSLNIKHCYTENYCYLPQPWTIPCSCCRTTTPLLSRGAAVPSDRYSITAVTIHLQGGDVGRVISLAWGSILFLCGVRCHWSTGLGWQELMYYQVDRVKVKGTRPWF